MTDNLTPERRSQNMRRISSKNTTPELVVRKLLHSAGYRYRLHVRNLPGTPDLVFVRDRKIIEVHGCFWHQHRHCGESHIPKSRRDYWVPKLKSNILRDKANKRKLLGQGWTVLTIWECEVKRQDYLKRKLLTFLTG